MLPIRTQADLDQALHAWLQKQPMLMPVAKKAGPLPLRLNQPGFAGLGLIIVSQLISRHAATAIWSRLEQAIQGAVSAHAYLALGQEARALGLSTAKHETLTRLAKAELERQIDLEALTMMTDEEALAQLRQFKGIGEWTANLYLMFCAGHPDLFPAGDVALRIAIGQAFEHTTRPDIKTVARIAEDFAPYRSTAARLFWAYYAAINNRDAVPFDAVTLEE